MCHLLVTPYNHGSVENGYVCLKGKDPIGDTPIVSLNHGAMGGSVRGCDAKVLPPR